MMLLSEIRCNILCTRAEIVDAAWCVKQDTQGRKSKYGLVYCKLYLRTESTVKTPKSGDYMGQPEKPLLKLKRATKLLVGELQITVE
jgi:hypothetical protein